MLRNGKRIQANAYAANAAIVMGMTVAGMVTMRLLMNALRHAFAAEDLAGSCRASTGLS